MSAVSRAWRRLLSGILLPSTAVLAGCGDGGYSGTGPVQEIGQAVQFGIWVPGNWDTCTQVIPDRTCVDQYMRVGAGQSPDFDRALHESWQTSNSVRTETGHTVASFNPYFQVFQPSRFYDPAAPNITGRPIAECDSMDPNRVRDNSDLCDLSTSGGTLTGLAFDDPRSTFNGVRRFIDINDNNIDNRDGTEVWYTDPFGHNARKTPFPGSIRQWVAKVKNNYGFSVNGPAIGFNRNYGAASTHAPN